jgi:hypothetical protein
VVVAARAAWGEYLEYAAYVCQSDRSFREGLTHFGFYYRAHIQAIVPRIIEWVPSVMFTEEVAARYAAAGKPTLAIVVSRMLADGVRSDGTPYGVMLLTPQDHRDTVRLGTPIANDTTTAKGKTWAWTLGPRYTRLDRLQGGAARTSEL